MTAPARVRGRGGGVKAPVCASSPSVQRAGLCRRLAVRHHLSCDARTLVTVGPSLMARGHRV